MTDHELDECWKDATLDSWSKQRLALAVIDAHGDTMAPGDVVAAVERRTQRRDLTAESINFQRRGSAVAVLEDGRWAPIADHPALQSARAAVRKRIEVVRRNYVPGLYPEVIAANLRAAEQRRLAHAKELASLRRVIVHGYPAKAPRAVEVVIGNALSGDEPWSRAVRCFAKKDRGGFGYILTDEEGYPVDIGRFRTHVWPGLHTEYFFASRVWT